MDAFEELRKIILKATDGDNSGGVTKKEFCAAMTTMSQPLTEKEAAALFKDITDGGYGKITTMKLDKYLNSEAVRKANNMFKEYAGKDR